MLWTDPFTPLLTQFTRQAGFLPASDLSVSENDLVLTLDLPGLTPDDLSIDVQGTELTVRGERTRSEAEDGTSYLYAQRPFGAFEHRIEIPEGVDPANITASMQDGVLSLIVPKPEPVTPKRIAIGSKQEAVGAAEEDRQLEPAAAQT